MPYNLIRQDRRVDTGAVLLLDTSTSMNSVDVPGGALRRIDLMARILASTLAQVKVDAMFGFGSAPYRIPLGSAISLEEPAGSTALHLALDYVGAPSTLFLLTDGDPDSQPAALEAMQALQARRKCVVHCYHCGPDGNRTAMAFLARLAALGAPGSSSGKFDLSEPAKVAHSVVLLLTHQGAR